MAVAITVVWGLNFVVIRLGVDVMPPLILSAARFLFAAFPLVFFVPCPKMPLGAFLGIACMLGIFSFAGLFLGIDAGLSPGIASIVLQSQVFFTAVLAVGFFGETLSRQQILGIFVAILGIAALAIEADGDGTLIGFLLVLGAAVSWAVSNLFMKRASQVNMLSLMVWVSLVPPLPLAALSLAFEGVEANVQAFEQLDATRIGVIAYLAYIATIFGFGGWAMLIARHGAGRVAPFSLLVPIFGMLSSAVVLGESFGALQIASAGLVIFGLALTVRQRNARQVKQRHT